MESLKTINKWVLLLLFSFAVIPPDFFHQFTSHHDTADCQTAETTVHTLHQHCASLQLSLPSCIPTLEHNEQVSAIVIWNRLALPASFLFSALIELAHGRAPPLV